MKIEEPVKKAIEIINNAQREVRTIHTGDIPPREFIDAYRNKARKAPMFRFRRLLAGNRENVREISDWILEDFRILGRKYKVRVIDAENCAYRGMILIDNKEVMYRKQEKAFYSDDANNVNKMSLEFEILWIQAKDFSREQKDD